MLLSIYYVKPFYNFREKQLKVILNKSYCDYHIVWYREGTSPTAMEQVGNLFTVQSLLMKTSS